MIRGSFINSEIRYDSQNGHITVMGRLLQDSRVDPSVVIRWASKRGHIKEFYRLFVIRWGDRNPYDIKTNSITNDSMFVSHLQSITKNDTDINCILSHRGYGIRKDCLDKVQTAQLKKSLTVKPVVPDEYSASVKSFPIYFEGPKRWYVPRFWGEKHCGKPDVDMIGAGKSLRPELVFTRSLRPEQELIVSAFRNGGSNGLICVPCGIGKTFMAIHEAVRIGGRFLVFVHTEFLADQWEKELSAAVPGIRIGRVQGKRVETGIVASPDLALTIEDIKTRLRFHKLKLGGTRATLLNRLREVEPGQEQVEYDCSICLIQTIASRTWPDNTFADFRTSIFDECHHMGAEFFSKALMSVQTKFQLGLSATPNRMDGLDDVFLLNIGPILYQDKIREADDSVEIRVMKFKSDDPAYSNVPLNACGKLNRARLCNQLAECMERTKMICDELFVDIQSGRKTLILSDRREHLAITESLFKEKGHTSIGYYVGGMTSEERDNSSTKQIILATFQLASEGMNIKDLNTIALITSHSNVEQAVGRIFRLKKEERIFAPRIYEILDSHSCLLGQYKKRIAFYKQCSYRILVREFGESEFHDTTSKPKQKSISTPLCDIPLFR